MNKDELVSYIQGLLDMNKTTEKLYGSLNVEFDSSIEAELLKLINKALTKHKALLNNGINYFNKKANEYTTPNEIDPIWNGPSEDLLPDDVDEGFIKHKQITKKLPYVWYRDEDGDDFYLNSNGFHYYLFSQVVTLKGDREQTIYTFGKKEWSKRNNHRLLRYCDIPGGKVVIEGKNGYPFLKGK